VISAYPDIAIAEKFELVAAVTLREIHRRIRLFNQGFQGFRIFGVDGDTYTGGQLYPVVSD
jgi:hypothetical protein